MLPAAKVAFVSKKSIRVTILGLNYAPEPTGNAPYTSSLAEGLAASGHSVHVIAGYPHYPEWILKEGYAGWARDEVINGVSVQRLRHHVPRTPSAMSRMHMELSFGLRLISAKWHKPDVVIVVSPALFSSAMAILRVRLCSNRPAVGIWVQDLYSRGVVETSTGGGRIARAASAFESLVLRSADGVVAIHDRFRKHIIGSLQVPSTNVRVIRNWTHLPASPTTGLPEMRAQLGWRPDEIIVLHAGNMGKKQGLENVINAAKLAQQKKSRLRFVLMGDGNQRKNLELMGAGLTHLQFIDPLPGSEFMRALAAAEVLLVNELPGVRDMAVPSKLTSYFNAGVPVIAATDAESVTAMEIAASQGGVRVDAADPMALVIAAEELGQDDLRAKIIGDRGLQFRHETLSEKAAIGHYDEFVSSLASSRDR